MIEYDLDAQDRAWLDSFNRGQNRLPPRRLELFLWRLELANAAATERTLAAAGGPLRLGVGGWEPCIRGGALAHACLGALCVWPVLP